MKVRVREASLEDVEGIVEAHVSDVEKWYRWEGGKRIEANYDELSVEEKWEHGGPWLSPETCFTHLRSLIECGGIPIVATIGDKVVGEVEVYIGPEAGGLGKVVYIDVMMVHRNYRRKGVGRELIRHIMRIGKEQKCNYILVWPEKRSIQFYKKVGFKEIVFEVVGTKIDLRSFEGRSLKDLSLLSNYEEGVEDLILISRRIFSSKAEWLKIHFSYGIEGEKSRYELGTSKGRFVYVLQNLWRNLTEGIGSLWIKGPEHLRSAFLVLFSRAKELGFEKLILYTEKRIYGDFLKKLNHKVISEEVVLGHKL